MSILHQIIDYVARQWDPAEISQNWSSIEVNIKDNRGYCITEGKDFQITPRIYSLQVHKPTDDLYPQQSPLLGSLTSAFYLATAVPFRAITCLGNLVHALNKGNTPEGRKHAWHAAKDFCLFFAAEEIYRRSPAPFGFHLVHYVALTAIAAAAISNPLGNRIWIHDLSRWEIYPLSEDRLLKMTPRDRFWAALDGGSYSLPRILGMARMGNKEVDKNTIEPIETKAK